MAVNFPGSPNTGDTYSAGNRTFRYDGTRWVPQAKLNDYVGNVDIDANISGNAFTNTLGTITERTAYNLTVASYDSVSVNQEESSNFTSTVTVFRFKPDGTKCYIGDIGSGSIHQYSLSTAWDLSTSSLDTSFSVSAQETQMRDIAFSDDGTIMFMVGSGIEAMFQYSLTSGWDLATASYDNSSFSNWPSVSEEPCAVRFNNDGTKCYVADYGVDVVWQFSLSTPYTLSTISYDSKSITGLNTYGDQVSGLYFNSTGEKLFISVSEAVGSGSVGGVFQFSLSAAFDISTASYDNISFILNETCLAGLEFKSDGLKAYNASYPNGAGATYQYSTGTPTTVDLSTGNSFDYTPTANTTFVFSNPPASGTAYEFDLKINGATGVSYTFPASVKWPNNTTPDMPVAGESKVFSFYTDTGGAEYIAYEKFYKESVWTDPDLANASYDSVSFSVAGEEAAPNAMFFSSDGTKLYVTGSSGDDVNEYDLSSAWDVSSASYVQNFSVSTQDTAPTGLFFKDDGSKMYVVGVSNDRVYEYDLSSAWDISTASYTQDFGVLAQDTIPRDLFFKPDGLEMYIVGLSGDDINQYTLSAAWDISTASYAQNFSVSAQETTPTSLFLSPNGDKLFLLGVDSDDVNEYNLSTAWDISSASYVQNFSVSAQEGTPTGLFFKSDGSKMYIVGSNSDTIYQYSTVAPSWTDPQSFDLSNISQTANKSISSVVTGNSHTYGFDPSGTYFFWAEYANNNIRRLVASTPFDISTLSADQSIARPFGSAQFGVELSRDGTKIFSYGYDGTNHVYSSTLSTPWDLTTVGSWTGSGASLIGSNNNHIRFSFDGTKLYTAGYSTCTGIRQYTLSTPWDVSTATYDTGIVTANNTTSLFLSGDGTDMVFYNNANNRFEAINMSTPWDLSTASTPVGVLSVSYGRGAYIDPNAEIFVTYNSSGTTLYEHLI